MAYPNKSDSLNFKQICLGHYKKILEISTQEFKGGYTNSFFTGNIKSEEYVTDKRKEFSQAVDLLALSLMPYILKDDATKTFYESHLKQVKLKDAIYSDKDGFIINEDKSVKHSVKLLELHKALFQELSCLMYRIDYLKEDDWGEEE